MCSRNPGSPPQSMPLLLSKLYEKLFYRYTFYNGGNIRFASNTLG
jgi:hypothetical protein